MERLVVPFVCNCACAKGGIACIEGFRGFNVESAINIGRLAFLKVRV